MPDKINDFFTAIKQGDVTTVARMLDESTVLLQAQDETRLTPVLTAAYYRQPEMVDLLVERGATLNLYEACAAGRIERVRALLEIDQVQANSFAGDGFQPLGLAAYFGHHQLAADLITAGAGVNTPSNNDLRACPLNSAAAGGHLEIARLLLEHGADPNFRQAEDYTPLHAAAQNGQVEMVRLLLEHGADAQALAQGKTPLDLAREQGHAGVIDLLENGSPAARA